MRRIGIALTASLATAVVTAGFPSAASAACFDSLPLAKRLSGGPAAYGSPSPVQQAVVPSINGTTSEGSGSIVGFWQVRFASAGNNVAPFFIPDGAPLDSGYAQWHSDRTEIMNSSRDPAMGNFCLGVWENEGPRTYKLNHFGLSWDNTGALCTPQAGASDCFVGPANIREEVTVNAGGDTYSGTVTIDQYDTSGHLLFRLRGLVSAQRITAD